MTSSAAPPKAPTGVPVPRPPSGDAPWIDRLRARVKRGAPARSLAAARRGIPDRWVPAAIRLRLGLDRRSTHMRTEARRQVEHLLGGLGLPDAQLDEAVDRYLAHNAARAELRWHGELLTHQDVVGLEHLEAALARGRGAVITFLHHGAYDGAFGSIVHAGGPSLHVVVASFLFDDDAPPFMAQHLDLVATGGNTVVDAVDGSRRITELLLAGNPVAIAFDVVGQSEVTFCGRRRVGSSGAARIAHREGVPVVPMTAVRGSDGRFGVVLGPTVEPTDHPDAESLLAALLAHHEAAVLDAPEGYDKPTSRWGVPAT